MVRVGPQRHRGGGKWLSISTDFEVEPAMLIPNAILANVGGSY